MATVTSSLTAQPAAKGVALVTGSARGIGKAIALRLAADGYRIALNDLPGPSNGELQVQIEELKKEIERGGGEAIVVLADVTNEDQVVGMIKETVDRLGSLDVMVANAGICQTKPFLETSLEDLNRILNVNVAGVYLCYKHAAKQMIAQGKGGRIIGASSIAGKQAARFLSLYSASKFAVRGLTQGLALEIARHGITVNAYAPGTVATSMIDEIRNQYAAQKLIPPEVAQVMQKQGFGAIGRDATSEEIAGLVAFLVSKEAAIITGQSVSINGGAFFD